MMAILKPESPLDGEAACFAVSLTVGFAGIEGVAATGGLPEELPSPRGGSTTVGGGGSAGVEVPAAAELEF